MSFLDNRIPPPLVLLATLVVMRFIAVFDRTYAFDTAYNDVVALLICGFGLAIAVAGVLSFKQVQTTVNPLEPASATRLVTSGIYRFTRNPMYLGMVLVALAWAAHLGSVVSAVVVVGFVVYISRFQIRPEEEAMQQLFKDDFQAYQQQTRRWL